MYADDNDAEVSYEDAPKLTAYRYAVAVMRSRR